MPLGSSRCPQGVLVPFVLSCGLGDTVPNVPWCLHAGPKVFSCPHVALGTAPLDVPDVPWCLHVVPEMSSSPTLSPHMALGTAPWSVPDVSWCLYVVPKVSLVPHIVPSCDLGIRPMRCPRCPLVSSSCPRDVLIPWYPHVVPKVFPMSPRCPCPPFCVLPCGLGDSPTGCPRCPLVSSRYP